MARRKRSASPKPLEKRVDETSYLAGRRRGAILKEEVWYEGDHVARYSLAYINPRLTSLDNGRLLGYDNAHEYHHRHFMGQVEDVKFTSYEQTANRFESEVRELWRLEDEKKE